MEEPEKVITIIFSQAPYSSAHLFELARLGTALSSFEIEVNAIFDHEAVLALIRKLKPSKIAASGADRMLSSLFSFGTELYVIKEALEERMVEKEHLEPKYNKLASFINRIEMAEIIQRSDFTIKL